MATIQQGLEDVAAVDSAISWIDGDNGELRYRGYPIGEIAQRQDFEETAYLLWNGDLPTPAEAQSLKVELRELRMAAGPMVKARVFVSHRMALPSAIPSCDRRQSR